MGRELSEVLGRPAVLVRNPVGVHDVAPTHLISTGSLAAARAWVDGEDLDRRRFRANVILDLDGEEPFAEDALGGRALALGDGGPVLEVISPTERCVDDDLRPRHPRPRQPGARRPGPGPRQPVRRLRPRAARRLGRGGAPTATAGAWR